MDNYLTGKEAREKIVIGAKKVVDAVAKTLGPAGANFLAQHTLPPFFIISNDGVTLARSIVLTDPYENMGASIIKEIAMKADKSSGDGTTTACVVAGAIIDEGMMSDIHPMKLKRELEACIPIVEEALKKQVKQIDISEVGKVASISAEDESIGNMIQEIYEKVGKDGIIFNDVSRDFKDTYEIAKGVQITDCGFASPYMADIIEGQLSNLASVKNPLIVITRQKIVSIKDLEIIGFYAKQQKKDLVIFADEFETSVRDNLVFSRIPTEKNSEPIRTVLIKIPIVYKDWWTEDIAQLTGATVIAPDLGITFANFTETMFGTCNDVIVDEKQTFLNGTLDITSHLETIKARGDDDSLLRVARLNKKTAKYHVGATTDTALKYRHDKVVDALGTAYHALQHGVLPGGGVALLDASRVLPDTEGGEIIKKSLKAPLCQIIENSGIDAKEGDFGKIPEFNFPVGDEKYGLSFGKMANGKTYGFDAKNGKVIDMFDENILDAYDTVFNSFKSAVSVASNVLTQHIATIIPPQKEIKSAFNPYE